VDAPHIRPSKDGVLVELHVIPRAKEDSVRCVDGMLKVKTSEPPDKGKANKAVIKLLKPLLGPCELIAGQASRNKTVLVRNGELAAVSSVIEGLVRG
jgi:uncharacterized protein